jgi:hypothetical protein
VGVQRAGHPERRIRERRAVDLGREVHARPIGLRIRDTVRRRDDDGLRDQRAATTKPCVGVSLLERHEAHVRMGRAVPVAVGDGTGDSYGEQSVASAARTTPRGRFIESRLHAGLEQGTTEVAPSLSTLSSPLRDPPNGRPGRHRGRGILFRLATTRAYGRYE